MKHTIRIAAFIFLALTLTLSCCKKKKDPDPAPEPVAPVDPGELITTFKLTLTDSATNTATTFMFKDPDGDGGLPAFYGPTNSLQTDSVISLMANKTYFGKIMLLDESKNPVVTISDEVKEEGAEHMFFYNDGANIVSNSANPYTVKLNGSNILITYTDLDAGSPQRGIGLETRWRTSAATVNTKHPLSIILKHQPESKNGTSAPGETDISVDFKLKIQ